MICTRRRSIWRTLASHDACHYHPSQDRHVMKGLLKDRDFRRGYEQMLEKLRRVRRSQQSARAGIDSKS